MGEEEKILYIITKEVELI